MSLPQRQRAAKKASTQAAEAQDNYLQDDTSPAVLSNDEAAAATQVLNGLLLQQPTDSVQPGVASQFPNGLPLPGQSPMSPPTQQAQAEQRSYMQSYSQQQPQASEATAWPQVAEGSHIHSYLQQQQKPSGQSQKQGRSQQKGRKFDYQPAHLEQKKTPAWQMPYPEETLTPAPSKQLKGAPPGFKGPLLATVCSQASSPLQSLSSSLPHSKLQRLAIERSKMRTSLPCIRARTLVARSSKSRQAGMLNNSGSSSSHRCLHQAAAWGRTTLTCNLCPTPISSSSSSCLRPCL